MPRKLTEKEKAALSMTEEQVKALSPEQRRELSITVAEFHLSDKRSTGEKVVDNAKVVGFILLLIALAIGAYWAWVNIMIYMGSEILKQGLQ